MRERIPRESDVRFARSRYERLGSREAGPGEGVLLERTPHDHVEHRERAGDRERGVREHVERDVEGEDRALQLRRVLVDGRRLHDREQEEDEGRGHQERPEGTVLVAELEHDVQDGEEEAEELHRAEKVAVRHRVERERARVERAEVAGGAEDREGGRRTADRRGRPEERRRVENRRKGVCDEGHPPERRSELRGLGHIGDYRNPLAEGLDASRC